MAFPCTYMRATKNYNSSINFCTQPKLAFNAGPDLVLLVAMLCLWLIVVLALLGEFLSVDIVNMTFCMFELKKKVICPICLFNLLVWKKLASWMTHPNPNSAVRSLSLRSISWWTHEPIMFVITKYSKIVKICTCSLTIWRHLPYLSLDKT